MDKALLYRRLSGPPNQDHLIEIWRDETGEWIARATGIPKGANNAIDELLAALNGVTDHPPR